MIRFQIPASLANYRSMADKTVRVSFDTQEISPEDLANIHSALQSGGVGMLAFLTEDEEVNIPDE